MIMFLASQITLKSLADDSLKFLSIIYSNTGFRRSAMKYASPLIKEINRSMIITTTMRMTMASLIFSVMERLLPIRLHMVVAAIGCY